MKWRMISISLTSGILPRSFLSDEPRSSAVSTSGTSSGGSFQAAFPGDDFSKIRPSFWLTCRVALRGMCVTGSPPARRSADRFLPWPRSDRSLSATIPTAVSMALRVVSSVQHHSAALPSSG